jgi:hypothetical protein
MLEVGGKEAGSEEAGDKEAVGWQNLRALEICNLKFEIWDLKANGIHFLMRRSSARKRLRAFSV